MYGGALGSGPGQFTEALFEMIGAYNKDGFVKIAPLINYAAWPWSEEVDAAWLTSRRKMMTVKPWPLPPGVPEPDPGAGPGKVTGLAATPEGRYVLARSLSHMRAEITQRTHARVVLGGKPNFIPGHHARYCRRGHRLPCAGSSRSMLFGGFGGAAGLVTHALLGKHPEGLTLDFQQGASPEYAGLVSLYERERSDHPELNLPAINYPAMRCIIRGLWARQPGPLRANGLSEADNRELFTTGSIDSALFLLMKGLSSVSPHQWKS